MTPFLVAAFWFSTPVMPGERSACDRAFDSVVSVSRREANFGYAREVSVEGRRAFVSDCKRHLSPRQTRCITRATTSEELYDCT